MLRDYRVDLEDIREAARKIHRYTDGLSKMIPTLVESPPTHLRTSKRIRPPQA
jgi:hypothetical protein